MTIYFSRHPKFLSPRSIFSQRSQPLLSPDLACLQEHGESRYVDATLIGPM